MHEVPGSTSVKFLGMPDVTAAEALASLPSETQFEICAKFIATGGEDGKGTGVPSMLGQGQKERLECERHCPREIHHWTCVATSRALQHDMRPPPAADYKYFKQYKFGDVTGTKPSLWDATMKAGGPIAGAESLMKFDAWTEVKGMSKEDALAKYVEVITSHTAANNREEVLIKFVKGAVTS